MSVCTVELFVGSTNRIWLIVTDEDGTVVNDATVTYELLDGTTVLSSGALTARGTDGYYSALVSAAVTGALLSGKGYQIRYTVTHPDGDAVSLCPVLAKTRCCT